MLPADSVAVIDMTSELGERAFCVVRSCPSVGTQGLENRPKERYNSRVIDTEGLTHLHLRVSDLDASLRFYQSVFGMREMFRDGSLVFLNTPGSNDLITLNPLGDGPIGEDGGVGHFGFRLKPDVVLDEAIKEVEAAGGKLISKGDHAPGVLYAYVADPDGYLIEL